MIGTLGKQTTHMCAYSKTDHLMRVDWRDGTPGYCRGCDDKVPLSAQNGRLVCPDGHTQHPLNAMANGRGFGG